MLLNPFFLYSLTWIGTILLYNFEISKLYPKLSKDLLVFIYFSIFISILLGIFYRIKIKKNINLNLIGKKYLLEYILIFLCLIIEFIYVGKIPLIETILKTGYTYMDFKGIKTFHVVVLTYNFYLTLCAFNDFQYTKEKKYLLFCNLGLIPYIFLYTRGPFLMLCICLFFIWLFYNYNLKTIIKIFFLGIVFLYIFGITGNIRHYYRWNDTRMIKEIAKIKIEKNILDPFIWSYVYITSPLGNLQYNINNFESLYNVKSFISENLLPDAISKRVDYEKANPKLMTDVLTVSTTYVSSYLYYGKIGMVISFLIYLFFEIIYLFFLRKSKYYVTGLSLVSILNIFSIFDNMFVFSGLSFCLVYPLIDISIDKIKDKKEMK